MSFKIIFLGFDNCIWYDSSHTLGLETIGIYTSPCDQGRSRKPRLRSQGICRADYATPLYAQKLALTSPTSGSHSVSIVHSRSQATDSF
jgi:hypothetical protein